MSQQFLHLKQVRFFYATNVQNPDWLAALRSPKRMMDEVDGLNIPENFQSCIMEQPHLAPLLKCIGKK